MPLKIKVADPKVRQSRQLSETDASTAKSTPPKTGTAAQIQRMTNTVKALSKNMTKANIRSVFDKALKMQGTGSSRVSDKDVKTVKKAMAKARGGKATKGRAKAMYGGKKTKGMARGGRGR
jgi:hypothetical protein